MAIPEFEAEFRMGPLDVALLKLAKEVEGDTLSTPDSLLLAKEVLRRVATRPVATKFSYQADEVPNAEGPLGDPS